MLTAVTLENEVLKAFFMLPATWSSKSRMVTASHPVFRFLLEETELNAAPVKNGPVT